MTEEELIEEGFHQIYVPKIESGDETDYYYYRYSFGNGYSMTSSDNTESAKHKWTVCLEDMFIKISNIEDVQTLIVLHKKYSKN